MAIRKVIPRSLDSAAASANLSFDANTLFVDSTNNAVGINTATPNTYATGGLATFNATNSTLAIASGNANAYLRLYSTSDTDMYLSNIGGTMNFVTAGAAKMYIASGGNVGIGTSSPSVKLHVTGTVGFNVNSQTVPTPDNGSNPVTVFTNNYSSGSGESSIWNSAATLPGGVRLMQVTGSGTYNDMAWFQKNTALFYTGNTERMRIDSSGNVGIGTSSPSTYGKFVVAGGDGNTQFNVGTSGVLRVAGYNSSYSGALLESVNTAQSAYLPITINGSYAVVATGGTERMRIDSSGNVGIGTASPQSSLQVSGAMPASPTGNGIHMGITSSNTCMQFNAGSGNVSLIDFSTSGTDSLGRLLYDNTSNYLSIGTNSAERMRIDSSGNVGIGITSPAYRLDVGTTGVAGNIHTFGSITSGTLAGYSIRSIPRLTNDTGTFENTYIGCGASVGNIIFQQGNSFTTASNTERMRIDSGGRVLINKTSNNGTSLVQMTSPASTDIILAQIGTNGGSAMAFLNSGGAAQVGNIVVNVATTAYNTSSDYRLKENIAPMTGALAKVALLKPVTYKWKSDGSDAEGFIAHELAEVAPQCVTGEKDAVDANGNPKYQGIDVSFLVATLTAAIQEQQALITQLQADVAALKAK